jgi:hypothetical protein
MTEPFSPAAQAVLDAANGASSYGPDDCLNESRWIAAAALRAAADQVEDLEVPWSYMGDSFRVIGAYEHGQTSAAEHLRVIAAELETSTPENR